MIYALGAARFPSGSPVGSKVTDRKHRPGMRCCFAFSEGAGSLPPVPRASSRQRTWADHLAELLHGHGKGVYPAPAGPVEGDMFFHNRHAPRVTAAMGTRLPGVWSEMPTGKPKPLSASPGPEVHLPPPGEDNC